jgi:hypothetical protein
MFTSGALIIISIVIATHRPIHRISYCSLKRAVEWIVSSVSYTEAFPQREHTPDSNGIFNIHCNEHRKNLNLFAMSLYFRAHLNIVASIKLCSEIHGIGKKHNLVDVGLYIRMGTDACLPKV